MMADAFQVYKLETWMLTLLPMLCLIAITDGNKQRQTSGFLIQHVSAHSSLHIVSSSNKRCAASCSLRWDQCKAFQFDSLSNVCQLSVGFCFNAETAEEYFVRSDVTTNMATNTRLALNKPSSMSSAYGGTQASKGNDGVYPTRDFGMFHTENEANPYWRVDLEAAFCISAVYFMNRGHSAYQVTRERARNIVVTVSLSEDDIMDTGDNRCGYIDGIVQTLNNTVTCEHTTPGRFVQLQMLETGILHFYEVEVHGY